MSEVIKGFVGRMATNVTTGVTTGLILTFITTYVLVDIKKDKDEKAAAAADSAKTTMEAVPTGTISPHVGSGTMLGKAPGAAGETSTPPTGMQKPAIGEPGSKIVPAENAVALTGDAKKEAVASGKSAATDPKVMSEEKVNVVRTQVDSAMKELDRAAPVKEKAEAELKQKPVELKKDVKEVDKRADDVFDELDKEVEQKVEE